MSADKREPSAMAHTPLMNVSIKPEVRSGIRPLSLTPDPRDHNADATIHNVMLRSTEYKKLKDRIKELEDGSRAISTSYSVLRQDVKEVEAWNQNLGKRIKELEAQIEVECRKGLECGRRERLLMAENDGLKSLLSKIGDRVSGDDNVIMDGESNEK